MGKKSSKKKHSKTTPRWREFELLIKRIHAQLYPGALVTHNEKILGASKQKRQFDVTIKCKLGPHNTLTVVDCKKHQAPVDIGYVEQFRAQANDVLADMAVIVSTSSFTTGAIAQANVLNVRLMTFEDASTFDWKSLFGKVRLKILDFEFKAEKCGFILHRTNTDISQPDLDKALFSHEILYSGLGGQEVLLDEILTEHRRTLRQEVKAPGEFTRTFLFSPVLYAQIETTFIQVIGVQWFVNVVVYGYVGDMPIDSGTFLITAPDRKVAHAELITKTIEAERIPDGLEKVELHSPEEIDRFLHESPDTSEPVITISLMRA